MTATTAPSTTAPYVPPGHPVRRFALAVTAVAVALLGGWYLGLGAPRATGAVGAGQVDTATAAGTYEVEITNDARLQLVVTSITGTNGLEVSEPLPSIEVPGGTTRSIAVPILVRCPLPPGPTSGFEVVTRGPLGIHHSIDVQVALPLGCP